MFNLGRHVDSLDLRSLGEGEGEDDDQYAECI